MPIICNPILPGFHPDPSILRVGDDYYIATSSFEWFPGVDIHHSRDLQHWQLLTHALTRVGQLDMAGNPNSGGVWAPCLFYSEGEFFLVYTNTRSLDGAFKDTPNYLVTAPNILGPWSDPVYLNSSGFDPSLFHDDDGRKWLVNMLWDHRPAHPVQQFAGIVLQEYDPAQRRLVGPVRNIFRGTQLGITEGPHVYKWRGLYYLVTAEGGTDWGHAVTVARAANLEGPYEADPLNPLLTSRDRPHLPLQKSGHASVVETQTGEWYLAHLCSRPITAARRCMLGRETALQRCCWTGDGWLRLEGGSSDPKEGVAAPRLPSAPLPRPPVRHGFPGPDLSVHWNTLRIPMDPSWASLEARPGWLRLSGMQSLSSQHRQALLAQRLRSFHVRTETCLDFSPRTFQQMAGLVLFYNTENWLYLHVTHDDEVGRCLRLAVCDNGAYAEVAGPVPLPPASPYRLRAVVAAPDLRFSYSVAGEPDFLPIGPVLDCSKLSDDYCRGWCFTGAFVGLCAQDLTGSGFHADFQYLDHEDLEPPSSGEP
eukprot:EG_transcript_8833